MEDAVLERAGHTVHHEKPAPVTLGGRLLRDELFGKVVVEVVGSHEAPLSESNWIMRGEAQLTIIAQQNGDKTSGGPARAAGSHAVKARARLPAAGPPLQIS